MISTNVLIVPPPPDVLMISPDVLVVSPRCIRDILNVLMVSPRSTEHPPTVYRTHIIQGTDEKADAKIGQKNLTGFNKTKYFSNCAKKLKTYYLVKKSVFRT